MDGYMMDMDNKMSQGRNAVMTTNNTENRFNSLKERQQPRSRRGSVEWVGGAILILVGQNMNMQPYWSIHCSQTK